MSVSGTTKSQSNMRLEMNKLKTKCKMLKDEIDQKDLDIQKLKESQKQGDEVKVKGELKRAHHILKQLKKRLNANKKYTEESVMNSCDTEYQQVMQ